MENQKNNSVQEEDQKIESNISKIKHRVAVFSGKGGVGKTTVSVNIAYGLQLNGFPTGILDADITGPNVAKMLGVNDRVIVINEQMVPFESFGVKMMSIASLLEAGQPVIWRGPMRSKIINQFLADVDWGELDYLIADLPPGTGDEILTIAQKMKPQYAVIVTTPQDVSVIDAERAINMARKIEIPYIGVVENMSGYVCPHCGSVVNIFGEGGGQRLADEFGVKFLGSIPIDINARISGDTGKPIILQKKDGEVINAFGNIVDFIEEHFMESECKETEQIQMEKNS